MKCGTHNCTNIADYKYNGFKPRFTRNLQYCSECLPEAAHVLGFKIIDFIRIDENRIIIKEDGKLIAELL